MVLHAAIGRNDGAGHFIKMVHNGIDTVICSLFAMLSNDENRFGMSNKECTSFKEWNEGDLKSYLIEITGYSQL